MTAEAEVQEKFTKIGEITRSEIDEETNKTTFLVEGKTIKFSGLFKGMLGKILYFNNTQNCYYWEQKKTKKNYKKIYKREDQLGIIIGDTKPKTFIFEVDKAKESTVFELSFIVFQHDSYMVVGQITTLLRTNKTIKASVTALGTLIDGKLQFPRTPPRAGTPIYRATDEDIEYVLGTSKDGLYIGTIYGTDVKVYINQSSLLSGNLFLMGAVRCGKTYTVAVIIEELREKGIPVFVIDPHGEYSFRDQNDSSEEIQKGRKQFGIEPKAYADSMVEFTLDIETNPTASAQITHHHLATDSFYSDYVFKPGQITTLNLKGTPPNIQQRVVGQIFERIFELRKKRKIPPNLVVLEEAKNFAPEGQTKKHPSKEHIITYSSEGPKFGAGLAVISQRPAYIAKSVIAPMQNKIVTRLGWRNDKEAVASSIPGADEFGDVFDRLPVGVAYVAGITPVPLLVEVRTRHSKHHGASINIDTMLFERVEKHNTKNIQREIDKLLSK